ncbi:hypothetical protein O0544_08995 [Edwardsiella anguillarum]|nr:hypothetical protein [Edwardsiella anguillarum]
MVVAIALLATQRFVQQRRQDAANDAAPPQRLRATLTEKRALPSPLRSRQRRRSSLKWYVIRFSLRHWEERRCALLCRSVTVRR